MDFQACVVVCVCVSSGIWRPYSAISEVGLNIAIIGDWRVVDWFLQWSKHEVVFTNNTPIVW